VNLATVVADFLVMLAAIEALTFTALYHLSTGGAWARDSMGRHVMAFVAVDGAVLTLTVVRIVGGVSVETPWFNWLRLFVFAGVPWVLGWRLVILIKIWRRRNEASP